MSEVLLSICIPTYNRADLIVNLVRTLLSQPGSFEVCVHVDGSNDTTFSRLHTLLDGSRGKLRIQAANNMGRAGALLGAFRMARGKFVMPFDDDDLLDVEGLKVILTHCAQPLPAGCVGHIYHMSDQAGKRIGSAFNCTRANFLSLRADLKLIGDKKEVVLADVLRSVLYDSHGLYRRTPTSLFWSRIALRYDVVCHELTVGTKEYLLNGMSNNIRKLKAQSAYPQMLAKIAQLQGYFMGRYRSPAFAARALIGLVAYGAIAVTGSISKRWRLRV